MPYTVDSVAAALNNHALLMGLASWAYDEGRRERAAWQQADDAETAAYHGGAYDTWRKIQYALTENAKDFLRGGEDDDAAGHGEAPAAGRGGAAGDADVPAPAA